MSEISENGQVFLKSIGRLSEKPNTVQGERAFLLIQ